MVFNKALASNVIKLRKKHDLTLAQLGVALGISNQSVSKIEKEKNVPCFKTLMLLVGYFDCSIDFLVGRTNNRNSHKA